MTVAANWGASAQEIAMEMACDHVLDGALLPMHRAVSVDAQPAVAFRWLCQLKLAPYSYDLLDNLGRRSPRELTDGAERLAVGQRFMTIFSLASFVHDEHITLRSRRVAVTYAVRREERLTRVVVRVLFRPPGGRLAAWLTTPALALGDLVMMRKQLLTLKDLIERDERRASFGSAGDP